MTSTSEAPAADPAKAPKRSPRAAHAIAQALKDNGVDRLFLVTGGDLWLWHALRDYGIEMHLVRSEAASVVMADAYARTTGRPAAVYGQWGPGATNVAGALADAWWARSPVVAITSTVSTAVEHKYEYQEIDQPPMFTSVTKWQARITRPDRAGELVARAVAIAAAGSPGPVHVDVPSDLLGEEVELRDSYAHTYTTAAPAPSPEAVSAIVERLRGAQRPLILAGNGVLLARGAAELTELAERTGVPVMTSMGGKGAIAESHPLAIGVVGRYSRKVCNELAKEADLVLAIGTDLGALVTDSYRVPGPDADIVQVDLSAERLGASMPVSLAVVADARETARALTAAIAEQPMDELHADWRDEVAQRVAAWNERFAAVAAEPAQGHVRPEAVAQILHELADPADVVVADTGFMGAWAGVLYPVRTPGRSFLRAAGTLGWAFPSVLGAQLAIGDERRAIAIVGDGGFGYNVGDLESAVRMGIPAITLVLNNCALAYEVIGFEYIFDGDVVDEVCDFIDVDHGQIARDYGAYGARVDNPEDLRTALREALAERRPAVIDVIVSKSRFAPVTTFDPWVARDL